MRGRSILRLVWLALALFLASGSVWGDVLGQVWYGGGLSCLTTVSNGSSSTCNAYTLPAGTLTGTESAQFIAPDVNFNSNGSTDYTIGTFAGNPTFFNATAGFNSTTNLNNTFWEFTGYVWLDAGNDTFSILHDDGVSVSIDGTNYFHTQGCCGPDPFTVDNTGSVGWHKFDLTFDECCGAPGYLDWSYTSGTYNTQVVGNGSPSPLPEPSSTQTLGAVLLGLGILGRVRSRFARSAVVLRR